MGSKISALCVVAVLLCGAFPRRAAAALGGDASSVTADRVKMQGALLRAVRGDRFELHEMRSAAGTTVREYLTSSGAVFAVTWQGPWLPDLHQLLGAHFDQYQRALQASARQRKGRGVVTMEDGDFVLLVSGRPRSFSGRAYLPRLMPQGVQVEAIQ